MILGNKFLSSFLKFAIYVFSHAYATDGNRSRNDVENTQLQFGSPLRDPFFEPSTILFGFRRNSLGTRGLDKLTVVSSCGDKYFLTLVQSRGDNPLRLRLRKCTINFTLCVD